MRKLIIKKNEDGEVISPPFEPKKFVSYSLCVLKLIKSQFEESQKLKAEVKFYPHYPNNSDVKSEYNIASQKNKELVQKSFQELEEFCSEASKKSEGECEQVKFYNRCIARMTETFVYWSKIDDSLTIPFLSRDTAVCQIESESSD